MRKKIGKRIGPVPIALVAVLALAAFISVGLLLVPSGSDVTHAQGLPEINPAEPETGTTGVGGSGCGITLDGDTADGEATVPAVIGGQDAYVAGGKCSLSGDSIDVVLENMDIGDELPLVVYTTGGADFPSVQALVADGDDADTMFDAAGEVGVGEHLITIPKQADKFGKTVRGAAAITVTRSMAGDDGKVYLFGYFNDDDPHETTDGQEFLIAGRFDVNRDGVISGDDDRSDEFSTVFLDTQIIDGEFNVVITETVAGVTTVEVVDKADDATDVSMGYVIVDGLMYVISAVNGAPPVSLGNNTATPPTAMMLMEGKADVNGDADADLSANDNRVGTLTGDFNSDNDLATVAIVDGGFDVNKDNQITEADTYDGSTFLIRVGLVYTRMDITGPAPVDLGVSPDGTPGNGAEDGNDNPDKWARNSAYHVPFAPNTENFFPRVFTNDSGDPTGLGLEADIVVLVRFQDPPALKTSDGKTTLSTVMGTPVNSDGMSTVRVTIKDANGVGLTGFANLVIDADAGSTVVFMDSNLKTHRVEIKNGTGETVIKGLPKTGAVRVKVTATFGDFEVSGDLERLSRATTLDVKTYSCVTKVGNLPELSADNKCRIEAGTKAEDLTEATSFAPGEKFLVVGTLKDAAGNTLNKRLSPRQLQPSGTTKAIKTLVSVTARDKMASTSSSPEYPAVTAVHTNSRMYATVDTNEANAQLGSYDIEVSGDGQKMTVTVTIAGEVSQISVDGPERIPTASGVGAFTVKATDANDNVPTNVGANVVDTDSNFEALVSVRPTTSKVLGTDEGKFTFNAKTGEATFFVQVADEAEVGDSLTITVTAIDDSSIAPVTRIVTYGDPPTEPGMPMNVMAEATSHDMIAVSWESPADDGGSAVTGYVLQSKTGTMDFMTIAASSAEIWWNTLDCQMMNAAIPADATPAPPEDDADMTSPYCAMYAGLSAEATTVVDGVFADEYDTISGTSHSDMGLMAETTYYYRVSAINSAGKGEYSDGMAMAMTMVTVVDAPPLGPASGLTATANADGSVMLTWTTGTSATHHFVAGTDGAFDATGIKVWKFSSAMGTHTVSADLLTSGTVYDFYVISGQFEEQADGSWPGKWAAEGWSNAATATAN